MKKLIWVLSLMALAVGCSKQEDNTGAQGTADSVYGGTTGGTMSTNPPGSLPGNTNTPGNPAGATGGNTPGGAPKSANP